MLFLLLLTLQHYFVQPPAWEQYQKLLRLWEQEIARLQQEQPSASMQQLTEAVRKLLILHSACDHEDWKHSISYPSKNLTGSRVGLGRHLDHGVEWAAWMPW